MAQHKLRTSREIYDQLRWDPRVDPTGVRIGYEARGTGMEELAFHEFVPNGDIPWHRIWYFRGPEGVLWDRRERIDRLKALHETAEGLSVETALTTPLPSFRFNAQEQAWFESGHGPAAKRASFTVLTWNVLFDLYDGADLDPDARIDALLGELAARRPDVVALQEVTPKLLRALQNASWVREEYSLTEGPSGAGVTPYGILLLSRLPLSRVAEHRLTRDKRILVAELWLEPAPVAVAVVHFTSDRAREGIGVRARERKVLLEGVLNEAPWSARDWLIVGDVNEDRDELGADDPYARARLVDVWTELHPNDAGFTFDPVRNPIARRTSSLGERRRLDRIYLRRGPGTWAVRDVALTGERAFASDHFAMLCTVGSDLQRAPPVHTSAAVIIPPVELWPPIEDVRQAHDRHAQRWMPHVNLLYGFVPADRFDEAAAVLRRVLARWPRFRLRLARLGEFEHRASATIFAVPEPSDALVELQRALEAQFPLCNEQSSHGAAGFTPHLSLGQCPPAALDATLAAWQRDWTPLEFEVNTISLIARDGNVPFTVRREVPLSPSPSLPTPPPAPTLALDVLREACARAAGCEVTLSAIGSEALGVRLPDSDLDLLVRTERPVETETFFARVVEALREQVPSLDTRTLRGARPSHLELQFPEGRVDLQLESPGLSPLQEATALLEWVGAREGGELFRPVLGTVRLWARARGIDVQALGYPGGFSWALLVAAALADARAADRESPFAMLTHVFRRYANWPWPRAVSLAAAGSSVPEPRAVMPIHGLLEPSVDTAHAATWSTRAVVVDELRRAQACVEQAPGDWSRLLSTDLETADEVLRFSVEPFHPEALGLLLQQVPRVLLALEADFRARLRPHWDRARGELRIHGAGTLSPASQQALNAFAASLTATPGWPPGTRLEISQRGPVTQSI